MARKPSKETLKKLVEKKHAEWEAARQRLQEIEAEEAKASAINPARVIALSSAFRALVMALKAEYSDALPSAVLDLPVAAFPRVKMIGRRYGLSETEVANAAEKGRKAVEGL